MVIPDEEGRVLMVCQRHEGKDIWMLPGGAIEEGENAQEAAAREVFEETGLSIRPGDLLWHVEEVSPLRGQRFVNYFFGTVLEGRMDLGSDPEFPPEEQVLRSLRFMSREEIRSLPHVYPAYLKDELWGILEGLRTGRAAPYLIFKVRTEESKKLKE